MEPMADDSQLIALQQLLGDRAPDLLFPCIKDLVLHGLDVARFQERDVRPNRQDVAMFVAAWLTHAGLTNDLFCTAWFTGYCVAKLSAISSSSPSQIRHSAKSNLKHALGSKAPFSCRRADNPFKAHCTTGCPHHAVANQAAASPRDSRDFTPRALVLPVVSKKAAFAAQFAEAMKVAHLEVGQGKGREAVAALLNERGFKTRTGREWTLTALRSELRKRGVGGMARGDPK